MKKILKNKLVKVLGWQVRRLRKKHNFKIVGVVGSIGKTSTKLAIAKALSSQRRVRFQEGNYNDIVSVPLVFFGHMMPDIWNIFAWIGIFFKNEWQIWTEFPFDIAVVELGTDAPGQIGQFRRYLHLDIAVVTAIAPEHMEFFQSLQEVAEEEWSVSFFSDLVLANKDLCKIVPENVNRKKIIYYGTDFGSFYKIDRAERKEDGYGFSFLKEGKELSAITVSAVSDVQLYSVGAALAVADRLGLEARLAGKEASRAISFSGRMQKLRGIKDSIIIDDTYNASPDAVKMALETLYSYPAQQRIAILGMMNELGSSSEEEHKIIGRLCNPKLLDLVVTIGKDANAFLSPAARSAGCQVYDARDSVEAGLYVKERLKPGTVVLAKGSQNGVFAEEALKPLLRDPSDMGKLVRQDMAWMKKKSKYLS